MTTSTGEFFVLTLHTVKRCKPGNLPICSYAWSDKSFKNKFNIFLKISSYKRNVYTISLQDLEVKVQNRADTIDV